MKSYDCSVSINKVFTFKIKVENEKEVRKLAEEEVVNQIRDMIETQNEHELDFAIGYTESN